MQCCPSVAQYVAQCWLPWVCWEHVQMGLFGVEGRVEATAPPDISVASNTWCGNCQSWIPSWELQLVQRSLL